MEKRDSIQTERYIIDFFETTVEFRAKKTSRMHLYLEIILTILFLGPLFVILRFSIRDKMYPYIFIFAFAIVCIVALLIRGIWLQIKKEKNYLFVINKEGIFHTDINKTYELLWKDIVSYGLIKGNSLGGVRRSSNYTQSCIVFSKELYGDKEWAKKLDRIVYKHYAHASTENSIVLDLGQEDDGTIYNQIKEYIERFCENGKEIEMQK